jgi:ferredoxin-NADP reductase
VARAAVLGRLTWQLGGVAELVKETPRVSTLALDVPGWTGHLAGQHVDVRLTAEDGYQAQRSYSIASPPEERRVCLTVERLDDGEVSPYLVGELRVGDQLELRGPIGGYFVWEAAAASQPLLLIAGGSGVVPLMAMLRHHREELDQLAAAGDGVAVYHALTRSQPPGWRGFARRLDQPMLEEIAWSAAERPAVFICGPTSFVEAAAEILVGLGHDPRSVRTERFGATGG